jgi:hypothetical protein
MNESTVSPLRWVRHHWTPSRVIGQINCGDRLSERAVLFELDEHGIRRALGDTAGNAVDIGDEQIIADHSIKSPSSRLRIIFYSAESSSASPSSSTKTGCLLIHSA